MTLKKGSGKGDRRAALRIVAIYGVVAGLWIYTSDTLLGAFFSSPAAIVRYSQWKGFAFIVITVCLLYSLIARFTNQCRLAEEGLERLNRELEVRVSERTRNLEESERRFRALVLASSDVVYRMSPDWSEMRELVGKDFLTNTRAPTSDWLAKYFHADDWPHVVQAIDEAIRSKGTFELEHRVLRADGTIGWTFSRAVPMFDDAGEIVEWFGAASDVTQRKRAEESLREAYKELEAKAAEQVRKVEELRQKDLMLIQQNRLAAMGDVLSNIAHHWRQPLNVLALYVQEIAACYRREGCSKECLEANIDNTLKTVRNLSKSIDRFRELSAPDAERTLFSVNAVVESTVSILADAFSEQAIAIAVTADSQPQINGYPNAFSLVLLSILMNAKDAFAERATSDARVTVRIWTENGKAVVTVTDNAGGIATEIVDRIFDAFFTTKDVGKGTGLNLFMAKNIIEQRMGGRLMARNVEGGAEFRIDV